MDSGEFTVIEPLKSIYEDISQESIDECTKIAKFNALNRLLRNNCYNISCANGSNTPSKSIANGAFDASIMIVEAIPSEKETFTGCFTNESGFLLQEALKNSNIKRSDIYCTTIAKCCDIRNANEEMVQHCIDTFFAQELKLIQPKKLVLTHSAFFVCRKYNIVDYSFGNINYFSKIDITLFNSFNTEMYIIYDPNSLENAQQRESFRQGLNYIFQ